MPQTLKTSRTMIIALAMAFTSSSIFSPATFAQKRKEGSANAGQRLQQAVDDIFKNPKVAEQELEALSSPSAKAYLAFLYFSNKSTFPKSQRSIDSLLRHAMAQILDKDLLGDLDAKDVHCTTMERILRHLRFISEAGEYDNVRPPIQIFEQNPEASMKAFAPFYYSLRERALPFEMSKADDFGSVPAVKKVLEDIASINGREDRTTNGTMVYGNYRQQALDRLKASLAPQLYFKEMSSVASKREYKNVLDFLKHWSTLELYNHNSELALERDTEKATESLAAHYRKRFHVNATVANNYAKAVLKGYTVSYLGRFSHMQSTIDINMPIYKVFATPANSIDEIKKKIGQRDMSKPELTEALRLQILNGGSLEVVEWLLRLGAPAAGGTEPPLLTAVERPEVVAALLKGGANVNETNLVGKNALIQAAQYNALTTIKQLLAADADINHRMADAEKIHDVDPELIYASYEVGGRTALMYAAGFADSTTIDYLVSKGADKKAKDAEGWTPAQFLSWNKVISKADKVRLAKEWK